MKKQIKRKTSRTVISSKMLKIVIVPKLAKSRPNISIHIPIKASAEGLLNFRFFRFFPPNKPNMILKTISYLHKKAISIRYYYK